MPVILMAVLDDPEELLRVCAFCQATEIRRLWVQTLADFAAFDAPWLPTHILLKYSKPS